MLRHARDAWTLLLTTVLVATAAGAAPWPAADGADALLSRWAEAVGGRERLRRIEMVHSQASLEENGVPNHVERWVDRRGRARTVNRSSVGSGLVVCDGGHGWSVEDEGTVRPLSPGEREEQRAYALLGTYLHLTGRASSRARALGPDSSGCCERLEIVPHGSAARIFAIDRATGLPARMEMSTPSAGTLTTVYEAWRQVDGVRLPARWRAWIRDSTYVATGALDTVAFEPTADSLFRKPNPGARRFRFAEGSAALDIPFQLRGNHLVVRGRLDGKDSVDVVLDTGASGAVMDVERARSAGLTPVGHVHAMGAGGRETGGRIGGVTLELPGFRLARQDFTTLPLGALAAATGRPMDVVIGSPIFSRCVVEVDYAARRLSIRDGDSYVYRGRGQVVPLEFEHTHPYVHATPLLPGRRPLRGRFMVDTGSSGALILTPEFAAREQVAEAMGRTIATEGRGVGGDVSLRIGGIQGLRLGGLTLERPIAALVNESAGRVAVPGSAGNIGGLVLRRFRVIFDYPRRRLILEPNATFGEPFEYDMSGLALMAAPPEFRSFRVLRVIEGSPASELDIRPGDEVETVDGRWRTSGSRRCASRSAARDSNAGWDCAAASSAGRFC